MSPGLLSYDSTMAHPSYVQMRAVQLHTLLLPHKLADSCLKFGEQTMKQDSQWPIWTILNVP